MAKSKTVYVCQECGRNSPREMGRCPGCGAWNSFVEEIINPASASAGVAQRMSGARSEPQRAGRVDRLGMHGEDDNTQFLVLGQQAAQQLQAAENRIKDSKVKTTLDIQKLKHNIIDTNDVFMGMNWGLWFGRVASS